MRKIISFLLIFIHYLFGKINISKDNIINFGKSAIFWKSKVKIKGKNNRLTIGELVNLKNVNILINGNNNKIVLSDNVKIYEYCKILIEGNSCEITIGEKSTIGSGNLFCGESNTKINIGKNCMLSREVFMNTSDFHSILDNTLKKRVNPPKNIFIDDHVWIGFNTSISKGAKIGKDSIVAARAFVGGKEYSSNTVLGGIPAKIIKENITWSREKLPY